MKSRILWLSLLAVLVCALVVTAASPTPSAKPSASPAASRSPGAGPTLPPVTLTFNIQLKSILAGDVVGLEAAADDDLGNQIGFVPGGLWNVTH